MRADVIVKGIVQGVGFRPFVYRLAKEKRLVGFVRNRGDAGVEIVIQGNENDVKQFITDLQERKPPLSEIYDLRVDYYGDNDFRSFSIVQSLEGGNQSGSIIPYDVSICNQCLKELRDKDNRRHNYFFTTCTECGPRYTIIDVLPYDRSNTTMRDFLMCDECVKEYSTSDDRRFHAQTIACRKCGPTVFLANSDGIILDSKDPIREAGRLLEEGHIVAIKGNGGFHIATSTTKSDPVSRLREVKHRSQKPFAIMARDLQTVKSFAEVNEPEEKILTSNTKPIVLLKKRKDYYLSNLISPDLHNIGVMLPYTGLHYMLFDEVKEPAFTMTSANPPSEPIVIENEEAIRKLGQDVDFFLFHNRDVAHRCDDSVVRIHGNERKIIRRSRGYTPSPIHFATSKEHCTLGVGAEENVNSCIILGDKAFISQYIGDIENIETLKFHKESLLHLMRLTNSRIEAVACDLHPKFPTTNLAKDFSVTLGCPIFPIQHHYAHALSLMGEKGLGEILGIVCDGVGYGEDGNSWGGEVLHCTTKRFTRLGHLEEQPMIGGDLAAKYPLRMVTGILRDNIDVPKWLNSKVKYLPHRQREIEVIIKQIQSSHFPVTTSCGRVLDAVSALLGICYERTYEGEPAMKLESAAVNGHNVLKTNPRIEDGIVDTTTLILEVFDNLGKYSISDLAYSAEVYIARGLSFVAVDEAKRLDIDVIGFSGGVAYNEHIANSMREIIEDNGIKFIVHDEVPPGDGGISLGQALAANYLLKS